MAHPNNSVKVIEVCKVAPQPPTSPNSAAPPPHTLPLTYLDILWLRFAPVQRLFFYEIPNPSFDTNVFHSILIPKLKTSLSLTLQRFLPLAGNIIWPHDSPKPYLTYTQGDTVSLTITESNHHADHFNHLSSINNLVGAHEYHPLVPQLAVTYEKAAAIALQVTIFPHKGFSIGASMHHAILDGKSSTMFVKSWAHICKLDDYEYCHNNIFLPDQLKPVFDRTVVKDPAGLEPIFVNQLLNIGGPNNRSLKFTQLQSLPPDPTRGTFVLSREKIQAIRQLVKQNQQHVHQSVPHLSTFCVTCAYVWVCQVKSEEIQVEKSVLMGFSVDCRSRLDPPLPENYFGNCISGVVIAEGAKGLVGEEGLNVAVNVISESIKSLDSKNLFNGAENWIPLIYPVVRSDQKSLSVAGSPRLEIYETDFGWGRPKKVEVVSIEKTGAMSLAECKDGGVEIGLVMSKHRMQVFAALFSKGLEDL